MTTAAQQAQGARLQYDGLSKQYQKLAKQILLQPELQSPPPPPAPPAPASFAAPSYAAGASAQPPSPGYMSRPQAAPPYPSPVANAQPFIRAASDNPDLVPPIPTTDPLVDAYHRARTSSNPSARDEFESTYPCERASCTNHEERRLDKSVTFRFKRDGAGWFLLVRRGDDFHAFPWFKLDLASERESFEGVFKYPPVAENAVLRVASAAILKAQGDDWIQTSPGSLAVDA
jgi:hypothetical protein